MKRKIEIPQNIAYTELIKSMRSDLQNKRKENKKINDKFPKTIALQNFYNESDKINQKNKNGTSSK